jgi:type IV secretory pathway VirB10-like protein
MAAEVPLGLRSAQLPTGGEGLTMKFYTSTSLLAVVLAGGSALSLAAKIPTNTNLNDNVLTCGTNARCSNKVMFGRTYKVIETAKFTVMVSISNEGAYTRADVSITNHQDYSQSVSPQDFRVEVVSPKPRVLLYVPPAELQNLPPQAPVVVPPEPDPAPAAVQRNELEPRVAAAEANKTVNIDELFAQAKREEARKEAAEKAAAQKHLEAAAIPANEVVRGRVYFEKDPKAKQVTVVLPISGVVFEFPYAMTF